MRFKKEELVCVAIDFQEKLFPAMANKEILEDKVCRFIEGMRVLDIPILVTQQYTKGLGNTMPKIRESLGEFEHIEKPCFSAWVEENFVKALKETGKKKVLILGIETHICLRQSVIDLMDNGYEVYVINDCCSSRDLDNHNTALDELRGLGARVLPYESVLFDILNTATHEKFKEISRIIK